MERQGAATQLQNCQNMNTLTREMNDNTRDLQAATQAQTQAILAKLDAAETRVLQDKLDAERQKSATLAAQLNNEHQTQAIMASVAQQNAPIVAFSTQLQKISVLHLPNLKLHQDTEGLVSGLLSCGFLHRELLCVLLICLLCGLSQNPFCL